MYILGTFKILLILVFNYNYCEAQNEEYQIPDVTIEAFQPSGLKVTIPVKLGVQIFGFHANLNIEIEPTDPGEFSEDLMINQTAIAKNGLKSVSYYNPNITLKHGDVIYYWLYVQYNTLGFKKENQKWTFTTYSTPSDDKGTDPSSPYLLEDNFDKNIIDENIWILEQYIPDYPDYEFVVYKKDSDVTFVKNDLLTIKPKLITDEEELKKKLLDLTEGCTKTEEILCKRGLYRMHNPIVSGRLVSKIKFSHATVEIRARLPSGDWIYPEIYLEDDNNNKLFIAYSRGNKKLTGNSGDDVGGSLLFGGPVLGPYEPERSKKLSSFRGSFPFSDSYHIYKLIWTADAIKLYVDNVKYGEISPASISSSPFGTNPKNFHLVLGLGVGGITDFPDGYKSEQYVKPWINRNSAQLTSFWKHRNEWYKETWNDNSQLDVDYVRIKRI